MNIIKNSILNPETHFNFNGLDYQKDLFMLTYGDLELDSNKELIKDNVKVGLRHKNDFTVVLSSNKSKSAWSDGVNIFTDLDLLIGHIGSLISFNNGGGLGNGIVITQQALQFSNLSDGENLGDLAYVEESQGTKWNPFSTYKPAGWYVWDGTEWVSDRNAIVNQLEQNILNISSNDDEIEVLNSKALDNEIIVKQASDLAGVLDSTKVYLIDGSIDMGTTQIIVPETGLFIRGLDYFVSGLYSTEDNYTMFVTTDATTASGNFKLSNTYLYASGTGSKLFDLDNKENSGAIEFNSCNIGDFMGQTTSLGEISSYRQFRTNDCGFFRVQDGLTFSGTWSGGFRINDTIVLAQLAGSTLFKEGSNLTFGGRCISDINAASADPTTITFDFREDNFLLDGGFQLTGASFAPSSSISVTADETSVKSFFRDCVEIRNTRAGFQTEWSTNVVTPLTLNTPAKALGATVTTNNTWFTQTGNNEITYDSSLSKDLRISVNITIDGNPNLEIKLIIRRWNNTLGAYQDVKSKTRAVSNLLGGNDVITFSFITRLDDISKNDRVEIWFENTTDNTDITVLQESEVISEVI